MATFQEEKEMVDDRISTLLRNYSESNSSTPISFEYYPPKTEAVVINVTSYINHHSTIIIKSIIIIIFNHNNYYYYY
jgi:hypothetical protein